MEINNLNDLIGRRAIDKFGDICIILDTYRVEGWSYTAVILKENDGIIEIPLGLLTLEV